MKLEVLHVFDNGSQGVLQNWPYIDIEIFQYFLMIILNKIYFKSTLPFSILHRFCWCLMLFLPIFVETLYKTPRYFHWHIGINSTPCRFRPILLLLSFWLLPYSFIIAIARKCGNILFDILLSCLSPAFHGMFH